MTTLRFGILQTGLDISTVQLNVHIFITVNRVWPLVVCMRAIANAVNKKPVFYKTLKGIMSSALLWVQVNGNGKIMP
jgi:hypothetical protein